MKFDRTPFMILTMARCGSYHLKSLLDSAPDIRCFGEVYKPNKVELPEKERQSLGLTKLDTLKRNQLGPDFLRRVVSTNSTQIVGIKAFLDHLGMAGCREMIFTEDWRRVLLTRNVIEQYVSLERARDTGIFAVHRGDNFPKEKLEKKVRIGFEAFEKFYSYRCEVDRVFQEIVARLPPDLVTHIDYSDLQRTHTRQHLLNFVGSWADPRKLQSDRLRQFCRPLYEGIENFEEFYKYLINTGRENLMPKHVGIPSDLIDTPNISMTQFA